MTLNTFHVFPFINISSFEMCLYTPLSSFLLGVGGGAFFFFLLFHIHFNDSTSSKQKKFGVRIVCLDFSTLKHGFHINETIFNLLINHWSQFTLATKVIIMKMTLLMPTSHVTGNKQLTFHLDKKVNFRCKSASELRGYEVKL